MCLSRVQPQSDVSAHLQARRSFGLDKAVIPGSPSTIQLIFNGKFQQVLKSASILETSTCIDNAVSTRRNVTYQAPF